MLRPAGRGYRFDWSYTLGGSRFLGRLGRQRPPAERLRSLLRHARETVPYYAETLPAGSPTLAELPVLTKSEVRKAGRRMWSTLDIPAARLRSSGTTGQPLEVVNDLYSLHYNAFLIRRHLELHWPSLGVRFRPFQPAMAAVTTAYPWETLEAQQSWCFLPLARFAGHVSLPFETTREVLEPIADFMDRARPPVVTGNPRMLMLYADALRDTLGIKSQPGPKAVIAAGEPLTPALREGLERFFEAAVIDEYSMSEIGTIGLQTPGRPGFLCEDASLIIEILDESLNPLPPGRTGLICITSLRAFKMPLIRYLTGDLGRLSAEGGPFTRIEGLDARPQDLLSTKDGGLIHPENISVLMTDYPSVARFQLVQESLDSMRVRTTTEMSAGEKDALARALKKVMNDPSLQVRVEVGEIEEGRKRRICVSRVLNKYSQRRGK